MLHHFAAHHQKSECLVASLSRAVAAAFPYADSDYMKKPFAITSLPGRAPWSNLRWTLFLPLAVAGNVVAAALAWVIVSLFMR
jgi:hypothetical protein